MFQLAIIRGNRRNRNKYLEILQSENQIENITQQLNKNPMSTLTQVHEMVTMSTNMLFKHTKQVVMKGKRKIQ